MKASIYRGALQTQVSAPGVCKQICLSWGKTTQDTSARLQGGGGGIYFYQLMGQPIDKVSEHLSPHIFQAAQIMPLLKPSLYLPTSANLFGNYSHANNSHCCAQAERPSFTVGFIQDSHSFYADSANYSEYKYVILCKTVYFCINCLAEYMFILLV